MKVFRWWWEERGWRAQRRGREGDKMKRMVSLCCEENRKIIRREEIKK